MRPEKTQDGPLLPDGRMSFINRQALLTGGIKYPLGEAPNDQSHASLLSLQHLLQRTFDVKKLYTKFI